MHYVLHSSLGYSVQFFVTRLLYDVFLDPTTVSYLQLIVLHYALVEHPDFQIVSMFARYSYVALQDFQSVSSHAHDCPTYDFLLRLFV